MSDEAKVKPVPKNKAVPEAKAIPAVKEEPKLKTFRKRVAGRRGNEGEEADFVTLDLVADRMGQIMAQKRNGRMGAVWIGEINSNGVFMPTPFQMDCEVVDGKPVIPKWAHLPDEIEAEIIKKRRMEQHFAEGNKRAIEPVDLKRLR